MYTTNLKKVGEALMIVLPPAYLEELQLQPEAMVTIDRAANGCLIVNIKPGPHYTLAELLAASDYGQEQPAQEREWIEARAVGDELI